MSISNLAGIILAAGKGTRMNSEEPKGLHKVCGLPMVELVARAMIGAGINRPIIVIGHGGERLKSALGEAYEYVWQHEQLGTGHAALQCAEILSGHTGSVIIAPGDAPLLRAEDFQSLANVHNAQDSVVTLLTASVADPKGYGRIVRNAQGQVIAITEEKDADEATKQIKEINTSIYCFRNRELFEILPKLKNNNRQAEYYLTDVVSMVHQSGSMISSAHSTDDGVLVGVNDRWQLALADKSLRLRILREHAINGVTILDPDSVRIEPDVKIGPDTVIEGGTQILGASMIGERCRIGPHTRILDSTIGDESSVVASFVDRATINQRVWVGPFANIRPGTVLHDGTKVGNFVELKNTTLGYESKANHLAYLGDTEVGDSSNIGAGTITANYDGYQKFRTKIGSGVFIGSNSTLVAPLEVANGAFVVAGSVITKSVPEGAGAFGRARQVNMDAWSLTYHAKRRVTKEGKSSS